MKSIIAVAAGFAVLYGLNAVHMVMSGTHLWAGLAPGGGQ